MKLLTFLYDEYIDRPKLSEQKKNHLSISSSPQKWVRTNNTVSGFQKALFDNAKSSYVRSRMSIYLVFMVNRSDSIIVRQHRLTKHSRQ